MANSNEGYWSRSYGLLTSQKGWIKPVLLVAAARLVPIVGWLGADGYTLEWGRLTAWGVDAAPKQKGVDIGACIGSGARAFVVTLGFGFVFGIISGILRTLFGSAFGGLLSFVISAASGIVITIAQLRATIYQSVGAGYQVNRLADMIKRDYNGLLRILGMMLIMGAVLGFVGGILISSVLMLGAVPYMDEIIDLADAAYVSDERIALLVLSMLGSMLPALFVMGFLLCIAGTFASMIQTTAVALWLRQFDVQHWGNSADPLPNMGPTGGATYGADPATAPSQWGEPQQAAGAQSWSVPQQAPEVSQQATDAQSWSVPQQAPEASSWDVPQQQAPEAQGWSVPQVMSEAPAPSGEVPTFALDDEPSTAPQEASASAHTGFVVPTFSLDDEPAAPAAEAVSAVPTFTLDDEPAPAAEAVSAVPTFTLDDEPAAPAAESEPATPAFTLDDLAPVSAEPEPVAPATAPDPEPFSGPVTSDDDARAALSSLELPTKPFDRAVEQATAPEEPEPAAAEPELEPAAAEPEPEPAAPEDPADPQE